MSRTLAPAFLLAAVGLCAPALASYPGNPTDMYLTSDSGNELYQFESTSPWNYVPGTYTTPTSVPSNKVFSNSSQVGTIYPYLGDTAGPSQDFWIGGFAGLTRVSSSTGAFISSVAGGQRLGPHKGPNNNVLVGGPSGVEEFDGTTGAFVQTRSSIGDGYNLITHQGNEVFVASWNNSAFGIKRFDFLTGLSTGPDIATPFQPQEIGFGPDGSLYAGANYASSGGGVYKYNSGTGTWNLWADTTILGANGPHGFAWDPNNLNNFYTAMPGGQIYRFDGSSGAFLGQVGYVPAKLTDLLFTVQIPAPSAIALLGVGGLMASRRRR